jgi:hypothetical protein
LSYNDTLRTSHPTPVHTPQEPLHKLLDLTVIALNKIDDKVGISKALTDSSNRAAAAKALATHHTKGISSVFAGVKSKLFGKKTKQVESSDGGGGGGGSRGGSGGGSGGGNGNGPVVHSYGAVRNVKSGSGKAMSRADKDAHRAARAAGPAKKKKTGKKYKATGAEGKEGDTGAGSGNDENVEDVDDEDDSDEYDVEEEDIEMGDSKKSPRMPGGPVVAKSLSKRGRTQAKRKKKKKKKRDKDKEKTTDATNGTYDEGKEGGKERGGRRREEDQTRIEGKVKEIVDDPMKNLVMQPGEVIRWGAIPSNRQRTVDVTVLKGKDLTKMDIGFMVEGKSDPYCVIKYLVFDKISEKDLEKEKFKTPVIKKELNPTWNYWCEVGLVQSMRQGGHLLFEVWDQDVSS